MAPGGKSTQAAAPGTASHRDAKQAIHFTVFERMPVAVAVVNAEDELVIINRTFQELTGYDNKDIPTRAQAMATLIPDRGLHPGLESAWRRAKRRGSGNYKASLRSRDGREVKVLFHMVFLDDGMALVSALDITRQARAEDDLRRSRQLMERAQSISGTGSFELNRQSDRLSLSPQMKRLLGIAPGTSPDGVAGFIKDLVHPADQEAATRAFQSLVNNGRAMDLRCRVLRIDGEERLMHLVGALESGPDDRSLVLGAARDVTEQYRAREELTERERYYRSLFQNTGTALAIVGPDGVLRDVNSSFEELTGLAANEVTGRTAWRDLLSPSDMERIEAWERSRLAGNSAGDGEFDLTLRTRQGETRYVHARISMVPGTMMRIASFLDITERAMSQRVTNALYGIASALASSHDLGELFGRIHDHLDSVLDATNFCIALKIEGSRDLAVAWSSCERGTRGRACPICVRLGLNLATAVVGLGKPVLRTGLKPLLNEGMNYGAGDKPAAWLGAPLRVGDRIIGAMCVQDFQDPAHYTRQDLRLMEAVSGQAAQAVDRKMHEVALTRLNQDLERTVLARTAELERKARELEEANSRLTELDTMKSLLISSVSHELRTPLTSILGFAKVTRKVLEKFQCAPQGEQERVTSNLDIIGQEAQRLTRLVSDFLDLEKINSGRMTWRNEDIDSRQALEQALVTAKGYFEDKPDVELTADLGPDLPVLHMDRDRLHEVLLNLLSNAAKFTRKGLVELTARAEPGHLTIHVRDTGPGIAREELGLIFDAFHTAGHATAEDKAPGTGLGLAIVKNIVEHYKGSVEADSEPGQGSVFTVRLPTA